MNRSIVTRTIITALNWLVDLYSITQDTGKQIAWNLVTDAYKRGAFIVQLNGARSIDDVDLVVDALQYAVKKGTILDFGAKKFAQATADADPGATHIFVEALAVAIADNAQAIAIAEITFEPGQNRHAYFIPNGTVMVEVVAENYKLVPRAIRPNTESASCVLLTDAKSDSKTDSLTGYGVSYSGICYENLMPDAIGNLAAVGTMPSAYKTELGNRFIWKRSVDSRGD